MGWCGYKLHVDTADGDIPVSAQLSSAPFHGRQLAIPMAQMTAERVVNLYGLMDAAYGSPEKCQAVPKAHLKDFKQQKQGIAAPSTCGLGIFNSLPQNSNGVLQSA